MPFILSILLCLFALSLPENDRRLNDLLISFFPLLKIINPIRSKLGKCLQRYGKYVGEGDLLQMMGAYRALLRRNDSLVHEDFHDYLDFLSKDIGEIDCISRGIATTNYAKIFQMTATKKGYLTMNNYYSATLKSAIQLLYFQTDETKFPEGVRLLEEAVSFGEVESYYFLSRCYAWEDGGVEGNSKKAIELVKTGIEKGSDLCILGADRMNALSEDVTAIMTHTLAEAFQGVKRLAETGDPMAQYAIGLFYFWGDMLMGIQKPSPMDFDKYEKANAIESLKWFYASAEQGCLPAFRNAFCSQCNGQNGVERNSKNALRLAEKLKDKLDLRNFYYDIGIEYNDLALYKDACRWYELGVNKGCTSCTIALGLLYLNGYLGKKDCAKAFSLFAKATEEEDPYGALNLGKCYYFGWGTEQDYDTAFTLFQKAAKESVKSAIFYLAKCYYYGHGTHVNDSLAFEFSQKSVQYNIPDGKQFLGMCYLYGKATPTNYAKAMELLTWHAQNQGDAESYRLIGTMYELGLGCTENIKTAVEYYQKAIQAGSTAAVDDMAKYKKTIFGKWQRR